MMKGMVPKPLSTPSTHTHTTPTPNPLDGGPAPLTVIVSFFGPSMPTPSCHLFCPPRPDAVSSFVRHPGARDRERSLPCTRPRTKKNEKENERDDRRESDPRRAAPETRHVSIEPSRGTIHHHQTQHGTPPRSASLQNPRVCNCLCALCPGRPDPFHRCMLVAQRTFALLEQLPLTD